MSRKFTSLCLSLCIVFAGALSTYAGGVIETIDITNAPPSPYPGQVIARIIGIKWDARSIPVSYSLNNTLDPIPNPLGAPVLTLAEARAALQASFDEWNNIPTSFIDMRITGTASNRFHGFDMINEITFRSTTSGGIAA